MKARSNVQITGISDSSKLSRAFALERKNVRQDSLTASRQHHSFQFHSPSKHNSRSNSVIHVAVRTSRKRICPAKSGLSDYNDPLQLNIAALRHDRKTSMEPSFGQNSLLSTQIIPFYTSTLRTNQNHGSSAQFAGNTSKNDLYKKSSREQNICSLKTNNKTDIHEEYHHKKPTTNNKYFSTLTNASSHTDNSSSNSQAFSNFHGNGRKVAQGRKRSAYKDDRESENRRRRKCCGVYCCTCSLLCMFLSALAILLLAAGIAALIIALLKPESVTTTTVASTTTTSITTTTSSSTSTTSTTSITTTTSSSTSTTSTTSTTTTVTTTATTSTSSTSSTSSTTTTPRPMCPITQPSDPIEGLYSTTAGGSTGGFNGIYSPYSQTPDKAIDNDLTTKYLNYGANGSMNAIQSQPGTGTGFYVTPTGNITVANGLLFATADDYPARDPLTVTLEGTNSTALNSSTSWTLIYSGPTGIDPINNATSRSTYGTLQVFSNTIAYQSYRLLMISQRSAQDSIQYAESHIMTYC